MAEKIDLGLGPDSDSKIINPEEDEKLGRYYASRLAGMNPNTAALNAGLADKTGMSYETIRSQPSPQESVGRTLMEAQIAKTLKDNPEIQGWALQNSAGADMSADDIDSLVKTNRLMRGIKNWGNSIYYGWKAGRRTSEQGYLWNDATEAGQEKLSDAARARDKQIDETLDRYEQAYGDRAWFTVANIVSTGIYGAQEELKRGSAQGAAAAGYAGGVAIQATLPSALTGVPAGALGAAGATTFFGLASAAALGAAVSIGGTYAAYNGSRQVEAGLARKEMEDAGVDAKTAMQVSQVVGNINGLLEIASLPLTVSVALKPLADGAKRTVMRKVTRLAIRDAAKLMGEVSYSKALFGTAKGLAAEALAESFTEAAQEFSTAMGTEYARRGNFEKLDTDALAERVWGTFTTTLEAMAILGPLRASPGFALRMRGVQKARQSKAFLEKLAEIKDGSKLAERAPDHFGDWVAHAAGENDAVPQTLYVAADDFQYAMRQSGTTLEQIEAAVGKEVADQVREADGSPNADIEIPLKVYAARISNSNFDKALQPKIRMDEDRSGLTYEESVNLQGDIKRAMDAARADMAEWEAEQQAEGKKAAEEKPGEEKRPEAQAAEEKKAEGQQQAEGQTLSQEGEGAPAGERPGVQKAEEVKPAPVEATKSEAQKAVDSAKGEGVAPVGVNDTPVTVESEAKAEAPAAPEGAAQGAETATEAKAKTKAPARELTQEEKELRHIRIQIQRQIAAAVQESGNESARMKSAGNQMLQAFFQTRIIEQLARRTGMTPLQFFRSKYAARVTGRNLKTGAESAPLRFDTPVDVRGGVKALSDISAAVQGERVEGEPPAITALRDAINAMPEEARSFAQRFLGTLTSDMASIDSAQYAGALNLLQAAWRGLPADLRASIEAALPDNVRRSLDAQRKTYRGTHGEEPVYTPKDEAAQFLQSVAVGAEAPHKVPDFSKGELAPFTPALQKVLDGMTKDKQEAVVALIRGVSTQSARALVAKGRKVDRQVEFQKYVDAENQELWEATGLDPKNLKDAGNAAAVKAVLENIIINEMLYSTVMNPSAIGWYDSKVRECLAFAGQIFPELDPFGEAFKEADREAKRDEAKNNLFKFLYVLAVTSNGLKVKQNLPLAVDVYAYQKVTGGTMAIDGKWRPISPGEEEWLRAHYPETEAKKLKKAEEERKRLEAEAKAAGKKPPKKKDERPDGLVWDEDKHMVQAPIAAGTAGEAIRASIGSYGATLGTFGDENEMRKFFMTNWSVRQLLEMGYSVNGEAPGQTVRGAALLGPKIGNGFFSNLNGLFEALTMDRWFMRTWGRLTGTLTKFNAESFKTKTEALQRFCKEVAAKAAEQDKGRAAAEKAGKKWRPKGPDYRAFIDWVKKEGKFDIEAAAARTETAEELTKLEVEQTFMEGSSRTGGEKTIVEMADSAFGTFMESKFHKNFIGIWGDLGQGFYEGISRVSRTRMKDKQAPAGPVERAFIREIFGNALTQVQGYDGRLRLTMADAQAALWYAEKVIYENLKVDKDQQKDDYDTEDAPDYSNVMRDKALRMGITQERIDGAKANVQAEIDKELAAGEFPDRFDTLDDKSRVRFFGNRAFGTLRGLHELSLSDSEESSQRCSAVYRAERQMADSDIHDAGGSLFGGETLVDEGASLGSGGQRLVPVRLTPICTWKPGNSVFNACVDLVSLKGRDLTTSAPEFEEFAPSRAAAEKFKKAIDEAKEGLGPAGVCVESKSIEEMMGLDSGKSRCRIFLSKDGKSGFIIKNGDDLVSVFSAKGNNSADALIECAIAAGARRLDCFDTILPEFYARHGFRPVARLPFAVKYAPPGWDYKWFAKKGFGSARHQDKTKRKQLSAEDKDKLSAEDLKAFNDEDKLYDISDESNGVDGAPDIIFMVLDVDRQEPYSSLETRQIPETTPDDYGATACAEAMKKYAPGYAKLEATVEAATRTGEGLVSGASKRRIAPPRAPKKTAEAVKQNASTAPPEKPAEVKAEATEATQAPAASETTKAVKAPAKGEQLNLFQQEPEWLLLVTPEQMDMDATYAAAVEAGDEGRAQQMLLNKAQRLGYDMTIPPDTPTYRLRTKNIPTKTLKAYKAFYVNPETGEPSALFASGSTPIPTGVWVDAKEQWYFTGYNGKRYIPVAGNEYGKGKKKSGGSWVPAPRDKESLDYLVATGFMTREKADRALRGEKVTVYGLAFRPGWHAGLNPFFPQGGTQLFDANGDTYEVNGYPNAHEYNKVIYEIEVNADHDLTKAAEARAGRSKDGELLHKEACFDRLGPGGCDDGFYYYTTNKIAAAEVKDFDGAWVIADSIKIVRALSQEEVDGILKSKGIATQPWVEKPGPDRVVNGKKKPAVPVVGRLHLEDINVKAGPVSDAHRKTIAPTYDADGNLIPYSRRFDAGNPDVLYQAEHSDVMYEKKAGKKQPAPAKKPSGPLGMYNTGTNTLTLTDQANLSTFAHETGHWYLETIMSMVKDGYGDESLRGDVKILCEQFGINSAEEFFQMAPEKKRICHEQFAAWVEEYMGTGKVKDESLAGLFQRFGDWIIGVYKEVFLHQSLSRRHERLFGEKLPELSDEVRGVLDRMVGAERQQAQLEDSMGSPALFIKKPAWVSEEEWEAYNQAIAARTQQGRAVLMKKNLATMKWARRAQSSILRKIQAEAKSEREAVRQAVIERLIRPGTPYAQALMLKSQPEGFKIRRESLSIDDDAAAILRRAGIVAAPGNGLDVTEVLQNLGTTDIEALVEAATDLENGGFEARVEQEVDLEMQAEHPAYATEEAMQAAADEALASQVADRVAAAELSMLRKLQASAAGGERLAMRTAANLPSKPLEELLDDFRTACAELEVAAANGDEKGVIEARGKRDLAAARIRWQDRVQKAQAKQDEKNAARAAAQSARDQAAASRAAVAGAMADAREKAQQKEAAQRLAAARSSVEISVAMEAAKTTAASMPVGKLSAARFIRQARTAAQRSLDAIAANNLEEAVKQKQLQLIYSQLARLALDARQDVQKLERLGKRANGSDKNIAKARMMPLVQAVRAMLSQVGVLSEAAGEKASAYIEKVKEYDPANAELIENVSSWAEGLTTNYKEMTWADFQEFKAAVNAMWDLSRQLMVMEKDGRKVELADIREKIKAQLEKRFDGKRKGAPHSAAGPKDQAANAALRLFAGLRRVNEWCRDMDGGDPNGPCTTYIYMPMKKAADLYHAMQRSTGRRLTQLFEDYNKTAAAKHSGAIVSDLVSYDMETGETDGVQFVFHNKAELLGALLHTGNASNKQKLIGGYGWGKSTVADNGTTVFDTRPFDDYIQKLVDQGVLTQDDFDLVQGLWNVMESLKPATQAAHKKITGRYFDEVTNVPFTVTFPGGKKVTYKGGYAPAKVDPLLVDDHTSDADKALAGVNMSFAFPTTGLGFTKNRRAYYKPLLLDIRLVNNHVGEALKMAYLEPAAREVYNLVAGHDGIKGDIQAYGFNGKIVDEMIIPWLSRTVSQTVSARDPNGVMRAIGPAVSWLKTRAGLLAMCGNIGNALEEVSGFAVARTLIPGKYLLHAFAQYNFRQVSADDVMKKSAHMAARLNDAELYALERAESAIRLNPSKREKAAAYLQAHGYFLQQIVQKYVDVPCWWAAYQHGLDQGMAEEDAIQHADNVIDTTMGGNSAEAISAFEVGTPLFRALTMFYSYFNMQLNLLYTETALAWKHHNYGRMAFAFATVVWIPQIISDMVSRAVGANVGQDIGGGDDDDPPEWMTLGILRYVAGQGMTGASNLLPGVSAFLKPAADAVAGNEDTSFGGQRIGSSPVYGLGEAAIRLATKDIPRVADGKGYRTAVRDGVKVLSLLTGLPLDQPVGRPLGYLADVIEGNTDDGAVDTARGLISGKSPNRSK